MARKPPQCFLAEIVAIVALCGLILGLLRTSDPRGNVPVLTFLMIGNSSKVAPTTAISERLNRLIPLLRIARRTPNIELWRSVSWGPLGADALIDLLGHDDAIAREEVTWALEAISGIPYGDDPDRWTAWFSTLPSEARERRHQLKKSHGDES